MKIRWTGDSVRFRITPSELAALEQGDGVREEMGTGNGYWAASLLPDADRTFLWLEKMELQISLDQEDIKCLARPETEGVYFQTEGEKPIRYYIEKDFPCAHPRATEARGPESQTFAAPSDFAECKKS